MRGSEQRFKMEQLLFTITEDEELDANVSMFAHTDPVTESCQSK